MAQILNNTYEILDLVGKGGMSTVFKARHIRLNKPVAVKSVRKDQAVDLQAEVNILTKLDHPNLVRIFDVFEDDKLIYIVMDYIEGEDLQHIIEREKAIPEEKVTEWFITLADILGYLHSRIPPIIYRDMKPANVILQGDGKLKLIDFGIAREFKANASGDTAYIGTSGFAAPEQFGLAQSDARTDIYSLGMTMYYLATGKSPTVPPYVYVPARQLNPNVSEKLERILDKCVRYNPDERYQSAAELMNDLTGGKTQPLEPGGPDRPEQPGRKPIGLYAGIGVAAIAVIAGILFSVISGKDNAQTGQQNAEIAAEEGTEQSVQEETASDDTGADIIQDEEPGDGSEEGLGPGMNEPPVAAADTPETDQEIDTELNASELGEPVITPVKAVDVDSIQKVEPGEYEDPDYSFSFRASQKTSVEIWTDPGYETGKYLRYKLGSSLLFMPQDDSASGHMGVYIHDLGVYEGQTVSLKVTYIWEPLTLAGEVIHPYLTVNSHADNGNNDGIAFYLFGHPYTVRCEIFDEDTGEPVIVRLGMNFSDVDGYQFFGLKLNDGSVDKIKCLYGSNVYYHKAGAVHWFYADSEHHVEDPLDSIRFNVKDCSSFELTMGDASCDFYSRFKNPLVSNTTEESESEALTKYDKVIALFDRYSSGNDVTGGLGHSRVQFQAEAYGPYEMYDPEIYVVDSDEYSFSNTLDSGEHTYRYRLVYEVPIEKQEYYYDLFEIYDELPEGVLPVSFTVSTSSGMDVSSRFTGEINDRTVTIRAVDPKDPSLYYECYYFDITVKVDHIPVSSITDNGAVFVNTGIVRIYRLDGQEEKSTNQVETHFTN